MDVSTLNYFCFSTNDKGNLFSLVMKRKNLSFSQSLNYIADKLGIEKHNFDGKVTLPFGGFFKKISKNIIEPESQLKLIDLKVLNEFDNGYNLKFLKDGIDLDTQEKFNIGFDFCTNRITIPEYSLNGDLVGIMGRLNDNNCSNEDRWLPIIPCKRSLTLFGYHQNYETIKSKDLTVIGESEKFVMQLDSFNCHIGLSTCGCHISNTQVKYLKNLMTKKIIIAFDEGLEEDFIIQQAEKLKIDNSIFKNNVGYIFDEEHKYLKRGSKCSPSDLGKETFTKLVKECTRWV